MLNSIITTEGIYEKGVVIPKARPNGRRRAIVTILPVGINGRVKSDEAIWREMRPIAKKIRKELFRRNYPRLYAKAKKVG